ncbi:hypothetical protein Taro_002416 [Colocasia esculenta]|uniref:Uncharacterized protein n=1 Tax=Colocasia esculenta TaxID=4460 RepID=A0A843TCN3_COLES|nr:hypothetical protein [Colocasia esculenta]
MQAAALLSSFPQPNVQLKHRSEGVQDRQHRPRWYNTSTGTNPEHNKHTCLAHTEPGVPDCRGCNDAMRSRHPDMSR